MTIRVVCLAFATAALVAAAADDDTATTSRTWSMFIAITHSPVKIQYWDITETQIPASSRKWPVAPFLPLVPVF